MDVSAVLPAPAVDPAVPVDVEDCNLALSVQLGQVAENRQRLSTDKVAETSGSLSQCQLDASVSDQILGQTPIEAEQFPCLEDVSFSKLSNTAEKSSNTILDNNSCNSDLLSKPLNNSTSIMNFQVSSNNISQNTNIFSVQSTLQTSNSSPKVLSLTGEGASIGFNPNYSQFSTSYAAILGATQPPQICAKVVTPRVVEDSIPLMGSSPDCGIMVERVRNSYLDDYASAFEEVAGKKSVIFIGQAPDDFKYILAFLASPALVKKLVNQGVRVKGSWLCVTHLQQPATKVIVSGVLPFIRDEDIIDACKSFGKSVYPKLRRIPAGTKAQQFNGVLSFRREIHLIFEKEASLPDHVAIFSHGKLYKLSLSTTGLICYRCSKPGHLAVNCRAVLDKSSHSGTSLPAANVLHPSNLVVSTSSSLRSHFHGKITHQDLPKHPGQPLSSHDPPSRESPEVNATISSPLLISPVNPKGEWVLASKTKKNPKTLAVGSILSTKNSDGSVTGIPSSKVQTKSSKLTSTLVHPTADLGPFHLPQNPPLDLSHMDFQEAQRFSDGSSDDSNDSQDKFILSKSDEKRKKVLNRKKGSKRAKKTKPDKLADIQDSSIDVHSAKINLVTPDASGSNVQEWTQGEEEEKGHDNPSSSQSLLNSFKVNPKSSAPAPASRHKPDLRQSTKVTMQLLDSLKSLKSTKRRLVLQEYLTEFPSLLLMVETAQSKLVSSNPGDPSTKTINKIKDDIRSYNKTLSNRSAKT